MTQSEPLYGLALSVAVVLVAFGLSEKRRNQMFAYFFTGLIIASISATLRPPGIVLVVFLSSFIVILAIGTRICARSAGNGLPVSTISKIYILAVPIML